MGAGVQVEENEVTLLGRAFDARRGQFPAGMAREILDARFPAADHARMDELSAKARAGSLLPEERALLDRYVRATNLLAMLKSKARVSLRRRQSKSE
ncbi:MAG: hypothetical protein AB7O66_12055 [Limisphaerales bacterium]